MLLCLQFASLHHCMMRAVMRGESRECCEDARRVESVKGLGGCKEGDPGQLLCRT